MQAHADDVLMTSSPGCGLLGGCGLWALVGGHPGGVATGKRRDLEVPNDNRGFAGIVWVGPGPLGTIARLEKAEVHIAAIERVVGGEQDGLVVEKQPEARAL